MKGTSFRASPVPLYYQLENLLRDKIASGEYKPGDRLPPEAELVRAYRVSRITVRQALEDLVKEGILRRYRGRGTFVSQGISLKAPLKLTCVLEDLEAAGIKTETRVLWFRFVPASPEVASHLRLCPGDKVLSLARLLLAERRPFSYSVTFIPEESGKHLRRDDLASSTVWRLLEEKCGIRLGQAEQTIEAGLADPLLSARLRINVGSPLLVLKRVTCSEEGRPVEYKFAFYRGDRSMYKIQLRKSGERFQGI